MSFASGKPMDVGPHPHIGLQTVSWLLEGEVRHHDSLGLEATATPGVLNLMTAGRGIAHAEETPATNAGHLRAVRLWVALPAASRETAPAFESHSGLPELELEGGRAIVFIGELAGARSPARALLIGGAPFGETILMWWNFVARDTYEIVAAREDWEAGRHFGEVRAYAGPRLPAPPFLARPVPR